MKEIDPEISIDRAIQNYRRFSAILGVKLKISSNNNYFSIKFEKLIFLFASLQNETLTINNYETHY